VVAEGVECEAQFMQLKKLGCSYMQGYLFAKPLLATEAARLLLRRELAAAS
jgi:EAL domain-containing protein (putative c-di-GMP-specific phosphodiesterase class I)